MIKRGREALVEWTAYRWLPDRFNRIMFWVCTALVAACVVMCVVAISAGDWVNAATMAVLTATMVFNWLTVRQRGVNDRVDNEKWEAQWDD